MNLRTRTNKTNTKEDEDSDFESDYKNLKPVPKANRTEKESKIVKTAKNVKSKTTKRKSDEAVSEYFEEKPKPKPKKPKKEPEVTDTEVKPVKLKSKNEPKPKPQETKPKIEDVEQCSTIESKIEMMLKMETIGSNAKIKSDTNEISEISDSSDEEMEIVEKKPKQEDDEEEDDFEEVEMNPIDVNINALTQGSTQITLNAKKAKKPADMKARMERMLKALEKKFSIAMIKTHLICWLAHGSYLNKYCLKRFVSALALSIDKLYPENFQLINFNKNTLKEFLSNAKKCFKIESSEEFLKNNAKISSQTLSQVLGKQKCSSYLEFILIILIALRNLNVKCRLCVCFDCVSLKQEPRLKGVNKNAKSKNVQSNSESEDEEPEKTKKSKSTQRKSSKMAKNKLKEEELSSDANESEPETLKKKSKSKNKKNEDEDFSMESENEASKKSKPQAKNKQTKKNNLILSIDDDSEQSNETCLGCRDTDYRNYWIEVYLEEEKYWCPVEPLEIKLDCANYLETRFEKRVLYVVGFDNDNKLKDVTKRYATEWETNCRLLRISHLEEKKLWWEKTLLYHQPKDIHLDMEEEKQLKEMLLKKPRPQSVSEFKDHPLYVLPRHLLKFQAIYPSNVTPQFYFREEPVYSRDNLVTLCSRQTWLKYARMVKAFEKPSKIVKGRLKRSEYKAGCRDNPDLDLYGFWQTKQYEPPYAEGGRVPRNDFGNVELFQPCMLPRGCVHLRNMPNLMKVCRKLNIDCAAAVVGFDAHGGFSHAVTDGWVVCEEYKDIVTDAYREEEREANKRLIEKNQERILNNWKRLIRGLLIREKLKAKYGTEKSLSKTVKLIEKKQSKKEEAFHEINFEDNSKVGSKLNGDKPLFDEQQNDAEFKAEKNSVVILKSRAKSKKPQAAKKQTQGKTKRKRKTKRDESENEEDEEYNSGETSQNEDSDYEVKTAKRKPATRRSSRQSKGTAEQTESKKSPEEPNKEVIYSQKIKSRSNANDTLKLSEDEDEEN